MADTIRKAIEFAGITLRWQYDREDGGMIAEFRTPSGEYSSLTIEADGAGHATYAPHWPAQDRDFLDRLAPEVKFGEGGRYTGRHPLPELVTAVRESMGWTAPAPKAEPAARERMLDRAETAAMLDLEGTPLAAPPRRPDRICAECGSAVYGEYCTHCMEG